jgi:hypothetical protein
MADAGIRLKQLPSQLEPWRAWLTLFPPELAVAVGAMLLRLQPLVGRLNSAARSEHDAPVGVGDIVQRGEYHRLLMTEWLIADAEPDEFIRRAANNELLFTGPEQGANLRSLQCIALFDVGPAQLGEPRLAHMALFILLARRAEEAGAQFLWGILQLPGKLCADLGVKGLRGLLGTRTLAAPTDADIDAWGAALASADTPVTDAWQLAGPGAAAPKCITSRVTIARNLLTPQLRIGLGQRFSSREATLDLPETAIAVRLLREPFAPIASPARVRRAMGQPSLKQAPRFSNHGHSIAVPQLEGGAVIFHVPQSPKVTPAKARVQKVPPRGSVLGAYVCRKSLSYVVSDGDALFFSGMPGPLFAGLNGKTVRPDMEALYAPVGLGRWLPTFFLKSQMKARPCERVLMIDLRQTLVCWEATSPDPASLKFKVLSAKVVGAAQDDNALLYASCAQGQTVFYRLYGTGPEPAPVAKVALVALDALFGASASWYHNAGHGLIALQTSETEWQVGTEGKLRTIVVSDHATVIGVVRTRSVPQELNGLIVLHHDRKKIQMATPEERIDLVKSSVGIAQVAWDADAGYLAWLTYERELFVRKIGSEQNLLNVIPQGGDDAS